MLKRDLSQFTKRPFDLLILGGDIAAAYTALDASLRGLRVALIAPKDFGDGLEADRLSLVRSGMAAEQGVGFAASRQRVRERQALLRTAPHLVRPLSHILLSHKQDWRNSWPLLATAIKRQNLIHYEHNFGLDPSRITENGRLLGRRALGDLLPQLGNDSDYNGYVTWDEAQVLHPARLVLAVLKTAVENGAKIANYVRVNELTIKRGRAIGVEAIDTIHDNLFDIRAKQIVDSTGLLELNNEQELPSPTISLFVLTKKQFSNDALMFAPLPNWETAVQEPLFAVPWQDHTLIGPFKTSGVIDWDTPKLLDHIGRAIPFADMESGDIVRVFSHIDHTNGALPLSRDFLQTSLIDHARRGGVHSLLSLRNGGGFETGRFLAQKVVDTIFMKLQRPSPESRTRVTRVDGGKVTHWETFEMGALETWPIEMPPSQIRRYLTYYGDRYRDLLPYMEESYNNCQPVFEDTDVTKAEIIHAVRKEMATKLTDLILRRTDMGIAAPPSIDAMELSAMLMGAEYNWPKQRINQEIDEALDATSALL